MPNCNQMMHKSEDPAGMHPAIVGHLRCAVAVAVENEIIALTWRAGEQRARE
jgi:hypothetical protein